MKARQLAVLIVAAVTVTACSSPAEGERPAPSSSKTTATTAAQTAEDSYIDHLAASGHFPGDVGGDARDLWIRTGRTACNLLKTNGGDMVDARFEMYESLIDYTGQGAAEPGLADRAAAVVEGASRFLCPEVPAS